MTQPLPVSNARRLLLAGCVNFVTIGISQSILGPSLEAIGGDFGIPATTVSLAISVLFLGAALAILASSWLVRRFGYRPVLVGALATIALGALLMTVAHNWPLALAAASLVGLGFGMQNVGSNLLIVRSFGVRSGPAVNLLSAMFGIGCILGPLLVGLLLPEWRLPFLIVAVAAVAAIIPGLRVPEPAPETTRPSRLNPALIFSLLGFVSLFLLYVSAEVGAASWEATHLTPWYGAEQAAYLTSLFWAALTVGRFLAIPVSARLRPARLVLLSVLLSVPGAVMTLWPGLAPAGYIVMGLAFAPVFPTTLVWIQQVLPGRSETMIPITMAAANLGPVLTSPLIGLGVTRAGSDFVPVALLALVLLLLLVSAIQFVRTRES